MPGDPDDGTDPDRLSRSAPVSLRVRTRRLDDDRPLVQLVPSEQAVMFVHGPEDDEEGLVGWGEALRVSQGPAPYPPPAPGPGPDRLDQIARALGRAADEAEVDDAVGRPGAGLVGFVSVSFDARSSSHSVLVVPRRVVGRRGGVTWLTEIDPAPTGDDPEPPPGPASAGPPEPPRDRVRYAGSSMPDLHWLDAVAEAIERIEAGELAKVVLARDYAVWSRRPFDPRVLAGRLRARFPACFTFLVEGLIGASPELLVRRRGERVEAVTLAGTAARGDTPEQDERIGRQLLASDKDRREHSFVVAAVRELLDTRCRQLSDDGEPVLLRLANVQHLATRFSGRLDGDETALELAGALHPTPAVGGTPTTAAIEVIRELEGMDRGRYAGPVGWMDHRGDGELAIALRCAELAGARARLFGGAGIVEGSLPEEELEETRVKLRAMQSAFSP